MQILHIDIFKNLQVEISIQTYTFSISMYFYSIVLYLVSCTDVHGSYTVIYYSIFLYSIFILFLFIHLTNV